MGKARRINPERPPNSPAWTDWELLRDEWRPSDAVLAETLDGGQAFRWQQATTPEGELFWQGQWTDCAARLRLHKGALEWSAPAALRDRVAKALPDYLGTRTDWVSLTEALPWRSDAHLATALRSFPSLRLLRQPFGETLLGFICSATKQIPQIKQMLAHLAARHGSEIAPGLRRLPTWAELADVSETALRDCSFGFRARHVAGTARFLDERPGWLEETARLPYAAAKVRLLELPGVGEKIADCVLLFGGARLESFPVDTWILKALARRYGLDGWKPAQVAQFGRAHFGAAAGLAQQYLFAWERRHG